MKTIEREALWCIKELQRNKRIREEDAAILFVSWNQLDIYLEQLQKIWTFSNVKHAIAIKTQPHLEILKFIVNRGFGLEAATWEEVQLALLAGCLPENIVFDSPVKRHWEIAHCAKHAEGILLNANSIEELERLTPFHPKIKIGLRINPLIETNAPAAYQVSKGNSKFGVSIDQKSEILQAIAQHPVEVLHVHASSSMENIDAAVAAVSAIVDLAVAANHQLIQAGSLRQIKTLDIGGGLFPEYIDEETSPVLMPSFVQRLKTVVPSIESFNLITEYGQWVHYHTGYAYTDIEFVNLRENHQMAYIHLGADFMLRDVYLKPRKLTWIPLRNYEPIHGPSISTDIAGPLCFANDFLQHNLELPQLMSGDGLFLIGTGSNAYGLWSRHTSRTIPAFYGVDFKKQSISKLSDRINPFLNA